MPALKYQLPSSPDVYVDLVDDEDVALMIDEWREAVAGGASSLRLHIFVQVTMLTSECPHRSCRRIGSILMAYRGSARPPSALVAGYNAVACLHSRRGSLIWIRRVP